MTVPRMVTIVAFSLVFVATLVVEWAARRPGSRIPTVGEVCGFVMHYRIGRLPVGRIAMFGFWWWLGWHFLAR
jgi:hypothetical protein